MKAVEFPEQITVIAKDQPQYTPLPAHIDTRDGIVTFCWQLSFSERLRLLWAGVIWHQVLTFGGPLQPQKLILDKPILASPLEQFRYMRKDPEQQGPET